MRNIYQDAIAIARKAIWLAINNGKGGSATVAIMIDGKIVYSEGFGMANREKSILVDQNTRFNIGSISKIYLVTAIMLLVEDGKISLDNPVTNYLPEFKMADTRYKKITVRMLLNHSSGLPGTETANSFGYAYNNRFFQETINTLGLSHLKHDPGEMSVYCNDGFTLAEMIVERVSRIKYIDFLKEKIFTPLNLKHTGLSVGEIKDKPIAYYYDAKTGKIAPPEVVSCLGAGGLSSTAKDLCHFMEIFSHKSKFLKEETKAEMRKTPLMPAWGKLKNQTLFGSLGWDVTNLPRYKTKGIKILGKGGNTPNYSSMAYTVPDKKISVAVITSGANLDAIKIALDILDSLLVKQKLIQEKKIIEVPIKTEKLPKDYILFSGYYANAIKLCQIVFNKAKNKVIIYKRDGKDKTIEKTLVYNNRYYYDNEGNPYYFVSIDGKTYLVISSLFGLKGGKIDLVGMQKIKSIKKPLRLKLNINGKLWLRRNVYPFEAIFSLNQHLVKSFSYRELPGYIDFHGIKKIITPLSAGMPFDAIRDQTELTLFNKNNTMWARVSDLLYSPAAEAKILKVGNNVVKIRKTDCNEWFVTKKDMVLSFITNQGRIIIFSSDGAIKYDNFIDKGDIYVAKGSYVELAGFSNATFTIRARYP